MKKILLFLFCFTTMIGWGQKEPTLYSDTLYYEDILENLIRKEKGVPLLKLTDKDVKRGLL